MRLLRSVTVMAICWLTCSSKAIPILPGSDLRTVVNTVFERDVGPTLNICDLMEIVKSASCVEFQSPRYETDDTENLKHSLEELLANYLNGRQSRQAQVGYNINSFGLRFGKRRSNLNLNSV